MFDLTPEEWALVRALLMGAFCITMLLGFAYAFAAAFRPAADEEAERIAEAMEVLTERRGRN